jgi:drug/metabolite transporter (DMT)-like permease
LPVKRHRYFSTDKLKSMEQAKDPIKPQQSNPVVVMTSMSFAVLALAFSSIFITQLERAEVPPLTIAFYRMLLATILLAPVAFAWKRKEIAAFQGKDIAMLGLGGLFLALHFGAWISSLKYIPIATSVVLVNSHPLFVVIASFLFLGQKPSRYGLLGTIIGLIGMLIISKDGLNNAEFALKGDLLAILGALAVVGYFIIGSKVRARVSLLGYVTPLYAVCSVFLFLWMLAAGHRIYPYGSTVWVYFFALAIVPTILGHTVFNWAIKHVSASTISLVFLGEPIGASILAFLFFGQKPPVATFTGGGLILFGIYLTMQANRTETPKSEPYNDAS